MVVGLGSFIPIVLAYTKDGADCESNSPSSSFLAKYLLGGFVELLSLSLPFLCPLYLALLSKAPTYWCYPLLCSVTKPAKCCSECAQLCLFAHISAIRFVVVLP